MDSQIPSMIPGTLSCIAEGIATPNDGRRGCESCREYIVVDLDAIEAVGLANLGRNEERIEDTVM